jgi:hypothetical protein
MRSPDDIQTQLLMILEIGIVNIRYHCLAQRYHLCAVEADHVHNIPDLIEHFSVDKLAYYLEVEVAQYLRETSDQIHNGLRAPWDVLKHRLAELRQNPTSFLPNRSA